MAAEALVKLGMSLVAYGRAITRECNGVTDRRLGRSAHYYRQAKERLEDFETYRDWWRAK